MGQANCDKSGIKFTLAFSGKYWHKKSDKMRVRKPYGKKWQNVAQANYGNEWYKLNNRPKFSETAKFYKLSQCAKFFSI